MAHVALLLEEFLKQAKTENLPEWVVNAVTEIYKQSYKSGYKDCKEDMEEE